MRKLALSSLAFAFILFILGPSVIFAQSELTGTWTTKNNSPRPPKPPKPPKAGKASDGDDLDEPEDEPEWENKFSSKNDDPNKIYISFERKTEYGQNQFGTRHSFSDLEGLTRSQVDNGGNVSFRLVREAGTIEAQGSFSGGVGSGTFRFVPNMRFVSDMKSRGFDFEKPDNDRDRDRKHSQTLEERLFSAATIGVTVALADDLRSANFGDLDVDDLYKAAIFKIDGKFMAEMKATGFPNLDMEDLVKARIFKIDADYVREVKNMGFEDRGFEGLVKFRIFKVTPQFLSELRAAGLDKLDSEDIVKCRIFKIDANFVREVRATEPNASIEDMVQMKIGVRRRK